ncbi:hypothetical protein C8R43DRAFT_883500 [Mycena crocata]|nr:hypothetical protein C8R43DRAFT_883500 [Mycena crocata]
MERFIPYDAILFPADGRLPSVVVLLANPIRNSMDPSSGMLHPEAHMDLVGILLSLTAQIVDALEEMNQKFTRPYLVLYPTISCDGFPFPVNDSIRSIQGRRYDKQFAWRGDIIVAKYSEHGRPFASLTDASIADFPILRNFFTFSRSPSC